MDVIEQIAGDDFRVSRHHRFRQRVVDEDVLVFRLDDVVALGAQAGHVAVDVDGLVVLEALQHRVDDDVAAGPPHAR